jgi:hypothetical protein
MSRVAASTLREIGLPSGRPHATPSDLLQTAKSLRATANAAEAALLATACEWADFHPVLEPGEEAFDDPFLPGVSYDATAAFALNLGLSDAAGTALIHEALELRHRLRRTWARVQAGEVAPWRARRIAGMTLGQAPEVVAAVDHQISGIAHKVGSITVDRLIQETKMRLQPVETEQARQRALNARHVKLVDTLQPNGIAQMDIRADLKDLVEFDRTLGDIAAALADLGNTETLDVRRSLALGVLADPQQAADLLNGDADALKRISPRKRIQLFVHLTPESWPGDVGTSAPSSNDPSVARVDHHGRWPALVTQIKSWCGRDDTSITVTPMIDLHADIAVTQYEVPERIKAQITHRDLTCVFPHCNRPAERSDHDHIEPYRDDGGGGSTMTSNIAALCRRHHRIKTAGVWSYQRLGPRTYLWTSRHGRLYLRDHIGSVEIEQPAQFRRSATG